MPRHRWKGTGFVWYRQPVERCQHCDTERARDHSTASMYLYRAGRAIPPNRKPMTEAWQAYPSGVVPKCPGAPKGGS